MSYYVVVDGRTSTGQLILQGQHHAKTVTKHDGVTHPVLICSSIDPSIPGYTLAIPVAKSSAHTATPLHLPNGTVLLIGSASEGEAAPFGFLPA